MYKDMSFLSVLCYKHKKSKRINASRAMMHETNINIMFDSASSSNHESISRSLSVLSMFSMMDSLKSTLSFPNLSESDRYILFCFRLPIRLSNCCMDIAGTLFSVNSPEEFVLTTLKLGVLAELGKRKICSFSLQYGIISLLCSHSVTKLTVW